MQAFRGLLDAGDVRGTRCGDRVANPNGDYARIPELAADLVQRKVDVIVVESTLQPRRSSAPRPPSLSSSLVADPVGSGLVTNLAHPGGNVTGLSMMITDLSAKRLQLLKETIPRLPGSRSCGIQPRRTTRRWSRTQGGGALTVDRAEFRRRANARAVRSAFRLSAERTPRRCT